MRHEKRSVYLTNRFDTLPIDKGITNLKSRIEPIPQPVRMEWNRDASAILVAVTIGCFIMVAAVLLHLFVDLNTGGLVQ